MTRIKRLLQQIECVEDMFGSRLHAMEMINMNTLFYQIEVVHKKVSIAEKRQQIKNRRSHIASVKH